MYIVFSESLTAITIPTDGEKVQPAAGTIVYLYYSVSLHMVRTTAINYLCNRWETFIKN